MKLTFDEIKSATRGALEVREEDGKIIFERFSKEQKEYYKSFCERFYIRTSATVSVMLDFVTDADSLTIDYDMGRLNMVLCDFMFFDVWEDDLMIAHLGSYSREKLSETVTVPLSKGEKRIRIFFPNAFDLSIRGLSLDGATLFRESKRGLRTLIHGDSITQGYDAHHPSLSFPNILIRDLELDAVNQAIGGEIFRPGMIGDVPVIDAELVLVAYGTNDWYDGIKTENVREFFKKLRRLYPLAKIFYISPVWLVAHDKEFEGVSFPDACAHLKSIATEEGVILIDGDKIMPKVPEMYADGEHPNDLGFTFYAKSLEKLLLESGEFPTKNN